uniref:tetratricopeptide repeat protein n=1 Tax=Otoolea muris TaxID=2941515 RepID=UPI002040A8B3
MDQKIKNRLNEGSVGHYVGGNQTNNYYTMFQDNEREFVVTHRANIKPAYYFTGRERELQDLRQRVEEGRKSVLVSGMGGIGKTHICRKLFGEYNEKHSKGENVPFRYIGFIEYDGNMDRSLQSGLKFKKQENPEQNQEAAWRELEYLAADGKLLLFVDNVDKTISADPGLKKLRSIPGAVVLTSRQASICDEFEPYQIGFLDTEQCREIYEKIRFKGSGRKVTPEEEQDLNYVIENLVGRHTLTVEHLAHLAWAKTWPARKLREKLEEKGFCLEFNKDGEIVNIQRSYEALYDLSELTDTEKNILEAFSVFPYIPLAAEVCNEWLLADAGAGEDCDILMGLYQKGWLQFDMWQESYALHPVFAQFIYEKNRPEFEKHAGLIKACKRYLEVPENGSPLECQQYIPFAENIIKKVNMGDGLEQVEITDALAYLLQYIAEYEKAQELYRKILVISERVLGGGHPYTATSYNNLAGVYASQGEYEKAEELYEKALAIRERVLGEGHPDIATSYNNLAGVYKSQGEYEKAEELYKKALAISERVLGGGHPYTATSYNNLAGVYESQGEYEKAEELYEKALVISERVLGGGHPDTATSYNNLAGVYARQGEYEKAEELYKKALAIRKRVLGGGHPNTATSYNNLAGVYESQGKYEKAEELYEKALAISERVLGEGHPDTATSYNNLAGVYARQGEYEKAEELYEKALAIRERVLGGGHPYTATSYNNLAGVYARQGEYEKAEELY